MTKNLYALKCIEYTVLEDQYYTGIQSKGKDVIDKELSNAALFQSKFKAKLLEKQLASSYEVVAINLYVHLKKE